MTAITFITFFFTSFWHFIGLCITLILGGVVAESLWTATLKGIAYIIHGVPVHKTIYTPTLPQEDKEDSETSTRLEQLKEQEQEYEQDREKLIRLMTEERNNDQR